MTSTRTRLVILKGAAALDADQRQALQSAFDLIEVDGPQEARALVGDPSQGLVLCSLDHVPDDPDELPPRAAAGIIRQIGEGIGLVDAAGHLTWANQRLRGQPRELQERFILACREAMEQFDRGRERDEAAARSQTLEFAVNDAHYELIASIVAAHNDVDGYGDAVLGVLWDITDRKRLEAKIAAIDAAGSELMKIQSAELADMNMAQRLKWLEGRIVRYVHELLNFDNFEIRLLDRQSNQLELVIAVGIAPLKIGEVIYAEREGNGISGYVAATGQSYICLDVRRDPLYREGLDNAGSSLTVPLYLHDQVIGVFNAESYSLRVFDENDRRFAEIFGRYIAIAMNILDLLVVERYTTNEQAAENVIREIDEPLADLSRRIGSLMDDPDLSPAQREELAAMVRDTASIRERVADCARGPRTILGAEQELRRHEPDPLMQGKRILIADDEPTIRETLSSILKQKGCEVTVCSDGTETIEALDIAATQGRTFDLVISDIKMPDRNGYEVFRAAKKINSDTPVILMTGFGYDPHHSIVRSSQEGLDSFLFKPFKATQLLEAITRALAPDPAA